MTSTAPESPEVVGARARERVALYRAANGLPPECADGEWDAQGPASPVAAEHARAVVRYAWRRPPTVTVTTPIIRREEEPPGRYAPVRLAVSPWVTWEQTQADEAAREPWAAIGERLATMATRAMPTRRMPWVERVAYDLDAYVSGAR